MSNGDDIKKMIELHEDVTQLQDAFDGEDFEWEKFIKKPVQRLDFKWFIIPIIVFSIFIITTLFIDFQNEKVNTLLFILGLANCGWVAFSTHHRYENNICTGIVFLVSILLLLVVFGFLTPSEAAEQAKDFIPSVEN